MAKTANSSALSVQVFGEATGLPISTKKVIFQRSETLPFVDLANVKAEIHLMNEVVPKNDVAGKVKLSLPIGASVKKFEMMKEDSWYPATAVPKKKAKAVVYTEKEKGRSVATVSTTATSSNVFEIEISPLPYRQVARCRLEIVTDKPQELLESITYTRDPNKTNKDDSIDCSIETLPSSLITKGSSNATSIDNNGAAALVGESFGKTHFLCTIPSMAVPLTKTSTAKNLLGRIAIFWDSSASMGKDNDNIVTKRCTRLQELLKHGETHTVELYSLSIDQPSKIGIFPTKDDGDVKSLLEVIRSICYDGGTDLTLLPKAISDFADNANSNRDGNDNDDDLRPLDTVLVFTDGIDSLGCIPSFEDSSQIPFPVHCIADANEINFHCLHTIAAASSFVPGTVLTKNDDSYLQGILYPQPLLCSIETDQDQDAFMEERDDGFCCIPDHRLQTINESVPNNGLWISGILGDSVSTLTATVKFGKTDYKFQFQLREDKMVDAVNEMKDKAYSFVHCQTIFLQANTNDLASRILGHVYARKTYKAAEKYGLKSGTSTKRVMEELSILYGFCSPECSLLMLFTKDQFTEHGIRPPDSHPVAAEMQDKAATLSKSSNAPPKGEIGGLKVESQKVVVTVLAKNLKNFFSKERRKKETKRMRSNEILSVARCSRPCNSHVLNIADDDYDVSDDDDDDDEEGVEECSRSFNGFDMFGDDYDVLDDDDDDDEEGEGGVEECPEMSLATSAARFLRPCAGGSRNVVDEDMIGDCDNLDNAHEEREDYNKKDEETASDRKEVLAVPRDPKDYLETLELSLKETPGLVWRSVYAKELKYMGGYASASPSLFINTARVLISHNEPADAVRIATNCLEGGQDDVQMLRSVGYVLLSAKTEYSKNFAKDLFDHIKELAPLEPQSFLDASLVRFWMCSQEFALLKAKGSLDDGLLSNLSKHFMEAQANLVHVITHHWADRFEEVEWAALILLHYLSDYAEYFSRNNLPVNVVEWPKELDEFEPGLRCSLFAPSLMVWLGWDTDQTDIDLHVIEPSKNEVYYDNNRGRGSHLSRDFQQGYGPEIYIAKEGTAEKGTYDVYAKYYSSHQDSKLTGATSAVVWTISVDKNGKKSLEFSCVRLNTQKEKNYVASATIV